jgi:hypothetical protein
LPDYREVSGRAFSRLNLRPERQEIEEVEDVPFVDERGNRISASEPTTPEHFEEVEGEEENFSQLFDPVVSAEAKPFISSNAADALLYTPSYMPVGNRELSIILDTALMMTQAVPTGRAYWQHLTQEDHGYRIDPDDRSIVRYLRILRVSRSSRLTLEVIRDQMVPFGKAEGKAFHIAMSSCRRDRKNPNVLKHANELLKLMDSALLLPDHRALVNYLDFIYVLEENPQLLVSLKGLDADKQRPSGNLEAMGRELLLDLQTVTVETIWPLVAKLEEAMVGAATPSPARHRGPVPDFVKKQGQPGHQVLVVLTRVRSLIDSILKPENKKLLSKEARKQFEEQAVSLRKYSKADVIEQYESKMIYATVGQQDAFLERREAEAEAQARAQEQAQAEVQAEDAKPSEAEAEGLPSNER